LSYRNSNRKLNEQKKYLTYHTTTFIFCGFNALTAAESKIIREVIDSKKQANRPCFLMLMNIIEMMNSMKPALFLRQLKKKNPFSGQGLNGSEHFKRQTKIDTFYSRFQNVGPSKKRLPSQLLQDHDHPKNYKDTAVVLCDENPVDSRFFSRYQNAVNQSILQWVYPINQQSNLYLFGSDSFNTCKG